MISCRDCRERLSDLLEDDFSSGEASTRAELRSHLESCAECRREWELMRTVRAQLRAFAAVDAPADLRARVRSQLVNDRATTTSATATRRPLHPARLAWSGSALLAACCLLLITRTPQFQSNFSPSVEKTAPGEGSYTFDVPDNAFNDTPPLKGSPAAGSKKAAKNGIRQPAGSTASRSKINSTDAATARGAAPAIRNPIPSSAPTSSKEPHVAGQAAKRHRPSVSSSTLADGTDKLKDDTRQETPKSPVSQARSGALLNESESHEQRSDSEAGLGLSQRSGTGKTPAEKPNNEAKNTTGKVSPSFLVKRSDLEAPGNATVLDASPRGDKGDPNTSMALVVPSPMGTAPNRDLSSSLHAAARAPSGPAFAGAGGFGGNANNQAFGGAPNAASKAVRIPGAHSRRANGHGTSGDTANTFAGAAGAVPGVTPSGAPPNAFIGQDAPSIQSSSPPVPIPQLRGPSTVPVSPPNSDIPSIFLKDGGLKQKPLASPLASVEAMAPSAIQNPPKPAVPHVAVGLALRNRAIFIFGQPARHFAVSLVPLADAANAQLRVTLPRGLSFADDAKRREKTRVVWKGAAQRGVAVATAIELIAVPPSEQPGDKDEKKEASRDTAGSTTGNTTNAGLNNSTNITLTLEDTSEKELKDLQNQIIKVLIQAPDDTSHGNTTSDAASRLNNAAK